MCLATKLYNGCLCVYWLTDCSVCVCWLTVLGVCVCWLTVLGVCVCTDVVVVVVIQCGGGHGSARCILPSGWERHVHQDGPPGHRPVPVRRAHQEAVGPRQTLKGPIALKGIFSRLCKGRGGGGAHYWPTSGITVIFLLTMLVVFPVRTGRESQWVTTLTSSEGFWKTSRDQRLSCSLSVPKTADCSSFNLFALPFTINFL